MHAQVRDERAELSATHDAKSSSDKLNLDELCIYVEELMKEYAPQSAPEKPIFLSEMLEIRQNDRDLVCCSETFCDMINTHFSANGQKTSVASVRMIGEEICAKNQQLTNRIAEFAKNVDHQLNKEEDNEKHDDTVKISTEDSTQKTVAHAKATQVDKTLLEAMARNNQFLEAYIEKKQRQKQSNAATKVRAFIRKSLPKKKTHK